MRGLTVADALRGLRVPMLFKGVVVETTWYSWPQEGSSKDGLQMTVTDYPRLFGGADVLDVSVWWWKALRGSYPVRAMCHRYRDASRSGILVGTDVVLLRALGMDGQIWGTSQDIWLADPVGR